MNGMNLLYIHTHDSGRYFEPYGQPVPTANLMELASDGTLFHNAYCAGPTCSPSRVGLLTGMSPHSSNMLGLAHRGFRLDDYSKHLSSYLKESGYETTLCGIQHEAADLSWLGYQNIISCEDGYSHKEQDLKNAEIVCDYIRNYDKEKPFFLSFGMVNTHREYPSHEGHINPDYVKPPYPLANTRENREDMADYIYSAQIADHCVGEVMKALKESGMEENTLVIFTTDHGIAMPQMKCSLYDTGIGVALILKYPGNPSAGKVTDALVSQIDVFPTICELLELPKPEWLQGVSLKPVLEDVNTEVRNEIFSEVTYHAAYEPKRCIRTRRYKLIRFFDSHNGQVPANVDNSPAKTELIESGWLDTVRPREMLFDLVLDPLERENLADDPRYHQVYCELSDKLWHWMEETGDPLTKYRCRVPKPAGARVNPLWELDPENTVWESED